jgi:hypothetical protein
MIAILLSLFSSPYFLFLVFKWWLGPKEYEVFIAYNACRKQFNLHIEKPFKWVFFLFFPALAVLSLMWTVEFTVLTDKSIVDAPFGHLAFATERPFTDVAGLYLVTKARTREGHIDSPRFVIVFQDASHWVTPHITQQAEMDRLALMVEYVAIKSQKPIQKVRFIEDTHK